MKKVKQLLSLLLAAAMLVSLMPIAFAADKTYTDVPQTYWGYAAIEKWSGDGYDVLDGDGTGKFNPDKGLTLAELSSILSKTFGYTEKDTSVSVTPAWATEYVQKAVSAGVITKAAAIDANIMLTREQTIKYIAVAYNITPTDGDPDFLDKADLAKPFKGYVKAFQDKGYVHGDNSDPKKSRFYPQKSFTRTETMTLINNMVSDIIESDVNNKVYAKDLILRKPAKITNTTVKGDLIVGQGVGDGNVVLDNVKIEGRLIAYGGGSNSIVIKGNSQVPAVIAVKAYGEPVRIKVQDGATVSEVIIAPYSSAIVNGAIAELVVDGDARVTLQDAAVESIIVTEGGANLVVCSGSNVESLKIDGAATVKIDSGAEVNNATIASGDVAIVGAGELSSVKVTGDAGKGVRIDTQGTKIENNSASDVTSSNGTSVAPGASKTSTTASIPSPAPLPSPSPAPLPSASPAPSPSPSPSPSPESSASVVTAADFGTAIANTNITNITVMADITVSGNVALRNGLTVSVNTGATLTVSGALTGDSSYLVINGTGRVNATGINNIGEGTYRGNSNGYWYKQNLVDQMVIDAIMGKLTGTGDFRVSYFSTTGTSPNVVDVLSGCSISPSINPNMQSYDPVTVTLSENFTIPGGNNLILGSNVTLVIPTGITLNVDGELIGYNPSTIVVEIGGKIDLAEPLTDLTDGTYIYSYSNGGSWGKITVASDKVSLLAAIADTITNDIKVNGNINVSGDVTLRNGVKLTVTSGSSLTINGQLKSQQSGSNAMLVIESGGAFSATGLTNLQADTYNGSGEYWSSQTWCNGVFGIWRSDLQNKFGYQGTTCGLSFKNPPAGVYLNTEVKAYIIEDTLTLREDYTVPGNAGLKLYDVTLTIPDGVTLTVGGDGISSFDSGLVKLILEGTGKVTGSTTISGAGTYVYVGNQWIKEIPIDVSNETELITALTTSTQGTVITIKGNISDIGADITIPSGVFVIIGEGFSVATTKSITASGDLAIHGTLTINDGGVLSGSNFIVGEKGNLTNSGTGNFAVNTYVRVAPGGRLGSITPTSSYVTVFQWSGSAWVQL